MHALFFLLVLALFAVGLFAKKRPSRSLQWPLQAKRVLTNPEQVLYFRLVEALPEHVVLAQVQLSRMLKVTVKNKAQSWRNRIDRKSADFAICSKDFSVLAVVELDDDSHNGRERQDADKDSALTSAGVRVIRWNVRHLPDHLLIRSAVLEAATTVEARRVAF